MAQAGIQETATRALEIGDAIALRTDAAGRVIAAFGACEAVLGLAADELDGRLLSETLDERAWAHLQAAWHRLDADTPEAELELEIGPPERSAQTRWHTLRVADDDLILFAADVTSRRKRAESLRRLVDRLPLLIAYIDTDLRYRYSNAAHQRRFAGEGGSIRGRTVRDVLGTATFERVRPYIERALASEVTGHSQSLPVADGGSIDTRTEYLPDVGDDGAVRGFYVVVQDVTEYRSTIDLMRAAHRVTARQDASVDEMIAELLALGTRHFGMPVGLVSSIQRNRYRLEYVAGEAGAHLSPGLVVPLEGTCCRNLVDSDDVFDFHDGPPAGACHAHPGFGEQPPVCYIGAPLFVRGRFQGTVSFASGEAGVAPFTEIDRELARLLAGAISGLMARSQYESQLEEANQRLLIEASTDALTGVYSRRFIDEILDREVEIANRHGRALAVAMIDLDHFKDVNDRHGHEVGDRVLRQVATACGDELRQSDVLARFGGEEFVVMLPETGVAVASHVAERLRACVGDLAVELEAGESMTLTASLGIAGLNAGESTRDLLRRADRALYRAKRNGRNRIETG